MEHLIPTPLRPERWLLACASSEQAAHLQAELHQRPASSAFAIWRLQHDLVRCVTVDGLPAAVRQALDAGVPAVHVHALLPSRQLAGVLVQARLVDGEERLVSRHTWPDVAPEMWHRLDDELSAPDGWVEVAWRLTNGRSHPVLAADGRPVSAQAYQQAFVAWRSERFKLGDARTSPFADEDGQLEDLPDQDDLFTDTEDAEEGDAAADDLQTDAPAPPTGRSLPGAFRLAPLSASAADDEDADLWFDIAALETRAVAPDGTLQADVTVRVQRQSLHKDGVWLAVRVQLDWPEPVAARARQRGYGVGLLPRWQTPVLLTVPAGRDSAPVPLKGLYLTDVKAWQADLPGTPVTVQMLQPD
jgi:hypothetical protein